MDQQWLSIFKDICLNHLIWVRCGAEGNERRWSPGPPAIAPRNPSAILSRDIGALLGSPHYPEVIVAPTPADRLLVTCLSYLPGLPAWAMRQPIHSVAPGPPPSSTIGFANGPSTWSPTAAGGMLEWAGDPANARARPC